MLGSTPAQVRREFGAPDPGSREDYVKDFAYIDFTLKKTHARHYRRLGIYFYFGGSDSPSLPNIYVYVIVIAAPNSALP
jgi:hypothetical protein